MSECIANDDDGDEWLNQSDAVRLVKLFRLATVAEQLVSERASDVRNWINHRLRPAMRKPFDPPVASTLKRGLEMSVPQTRRQLEARIERLSRHHWIDGCGRPNWLAVLTVELRDLIRGRQK